MTALLCVAGLGSCAGLLAFFISTGRALKKFDSLDAGTQRKLLLLDYYMAAVRGLSTDDLLLLASLPDEALRSLNAAGSGGLPQAVRKMLAPAHSEE
jgi:hypothetical protein